MLFYIQLQYNYYFLLLLCSFKKIIIIIMHFTQKDTLRPNQFPNNAAAAMSKRVEIDAYPCLIYQF